MSVARSDDTLVSRLVGLGGALCEHCGLGMSRLFDLFNNSENPKSCKCEAYPSSARGRELGWLI